MWTADARARAADAVAARVEGYQTLMRALLAADPSLSTDALAARLGYDRSTVRRWRRALREG